MWYRVKLILLMVIGAFGVSVLIGVWRLFSRNSYVGAEEEQLWVPSESLSTTDPQNASSTAPGRMPSPAHSGPPEGAPTAANLSALD